MQTNRRILLHLVALGRITPAEAERLSIAWDDGRESLWALIACAAVAVLSQIDSRWGLVALAHIAHLLPHAGPLAVRHVVTLATHLLGGSV
jgi:hypothetical protein